MRAFTNVLYAVAILAMVNLACGGPQNGDRDGGNSTVADGGDNQLPPTPTLKVESVGVDNATLGCSTDDGTVEISYWGYNDGSSYDQHTKVFNAAPYVLQNLIPSVQGSNYCSYAVAIKDDNRSARSPTLCFTTAPMPDPCAGLVVPLADKCSDTGNPPYGEEVWTLQPSPHDDSKCLLVGTELVFIMTKAMSGATQFTAPLLGGSYETCVQ